MGGHNRFFPRPYFWLGIGAGSDTEMVRKALAWGSSWLAKSHFLFPSVARVLSNVQYLVLGPELGLEW